MRALITGKEGFVGQYLAELLKSKGIRVYGFDMRHGQDLRNYEQVRNTLDKIRPDLIFHLAAQAYVPESFTNPARTFEINIIGSLNILEAVKNLGISTRIQMAGTSEEYGSARKNSELDLPEPKSPYAISKLAMDHLGKWYSDTYGMNVVTTRAFNHTGAGRGEMYAESSFAKQIAQIEASKKPGVLNHGNLESIRNYTDVRDIVEGYYQAIFLPPGTYNICSGQNLTMHEILRRLLSFTDAEIKLRADPARMRKSDFSFARPSAKKFKDLTDWKPKYKINDTLLDILNYWRERVHQ